MPSDVILNQDNVTIQGELRAEQTARMYGELHVNQTTHLNGDLHVNQTAHLNGTLNLQDGLLVHGPVSISTDNPVSPQRVLHVAGQEVHSAEGFSFADRGSANFSEVPTNGERWVWCSQDGTARLWSGGDRLTVSAKGQLAAQELTLGDPQGAHIKLDNKGIVISGPAAAPVIGYESLHLTNSGIVLVSQVPGLPVQPAQVNLLEQIRGLQTAVAELTRRLDAGGIPR